jgi:hypothetical protein
MLSHPPAQPISQPSSASSSLPNVPFAAPLIAHNPPHTPAGAHVTSNAMEPNVPNLTLPVCPTTPSPIKFVFAPSGRIPIKRSKPIHLQDTPTKRLKPAERNSITRSASKNSLVTQSQSGDDELFHEDTDMTVCHPYLTDLPLLFTACTDQGQRFTLASWPLVVDIRDDVNMLEWADQLGRACNAESLSRKPSCLYHTSKSLPTFIVWIIVTMILFCLIKSAAATETPAGSLSLFVLNTNGFVHPTKIDATN